MIDLHSHVLFGLDDGAGDLSESVAICKAAAADGITVLAATPHVRDDYPTTPDEMEERLAAVRAAVDFIRLLPGGEIDLAELDRPAGELRRFALAGNPAYLLVEMPYRGWPLDLGERLYRLAARGVTPVLAHPERNDEVQQQPERLQQLIGSGVLVQVTAASVEGRMGRRAKACAETLLADGLVHLLASDGHTPDVRAIGMSGAVRAIGDDELAHWLTVGVPGAIVEGTELPPRPARKARPRRSFFRR